MAESMVSSLQKGGSSSGGGSEAFFTQSAINFLSSCIYFFARFENGKYSDLPHILSFMNRSYKDIFDTLEYVKRSAEKNKADKFMGLYGLPLLSLGYNILPHSASEEIIKIGYSNPLLAMSNIGLLDSNKLALNGHKPSDGFMTGAVKYKPYVLLSATSLNGELTLSMCVRGNEKDKIVVEKFFDLMEKNIKVIAEEKI